MIKTRITELLGIRYPIMQGGMQFLSTVKLAAAVSSAGAIGTINATNFSSPEAFRSALKELRALTDAPFCVNINLLPDANLGKNVAKYVEICAEEGARAIETAGSRPTGLVPLIHSFGMVHIHKVPGCRYALSAQDDGVDAVSVVGLECGGHPGADSIGTIVLAELAARSLDIPVIAGGGIADGRGAVAALALGAEGIVMGTRFIASEEANIGTDKKEWITHAGEHDTVLVKQGEKMVMRAAKIEGTLFPAGVCSCLIKSIKPAAQIVADIVSEMEDTISKLQTYRDM